MTLDELKDRWNENDRTLDATLRLNTRLLRASTLGKAETAMRRLSRLLGIEVALNLVATIVLGSFIADHLGEPRFLLPAAALHLCAIGLVIAGIHQLAAIGRLDYAAPIVAIQRKLESLRWLRTRITQWTLLVAPLLWTPLLIVGLKGLVGVDAYAVFRGDWLLANLLFGAAVIPAALWLSRRYADRLEQSSLARRLMRDIAGHNVNAALGFLDALARFEEEKVA